MLARAGIAGAFAQASSIRTYREKQNTMACMAFPSDPNVCS